MDSLSSQIEQLLHMQHTVLTRLDGLSHNLGEVGQDLASLRAAGAEGPGQGAQDSEVLEVCLDVRGMVQETNRRMECQALKLEGVEKLVEGMQQVLSFIGEVVKKSRLVEVLFKQSGKRARKKVSWILVTVKLRLSLRLDSCLLSFSRENDGKMFQWSWFPYSRSVVLLSWVEIFNMLFNICE